MTKETDRELLALAAKAIGIEVIGPMGDDGLVLFNGKRWNPLEDDGDDARLEAKVGINIEWQAVGVIASVNGGERFREAFSDHGGDKQAARRWASVRAAAEVVRVMP